MSGQTVSRSESLRRLRELRTAVARYFELVDALEAMPDDAPQWPPRTDGPSERTKLGSAVKEQKQRLRHLERGLLPDNFAYDADTVDFVIKAIDMRRATSIRQALNQYEDWRAREDAAERRHQEAMREARLNADHVASNAAWNQAMSDYLRNL